MAHFLLHCPVVMSGTSRDKLNHLSDDFVHQFKPRERKIIIEAFLQTDSRTQGIQAPRPFQLECAITLGTGRDLVCTAGCGAEKTLAMALPVMMLGEGKIALTIVPLKLLQENHVLTFVLTISD
jgi:superfamily II DNA/RNA helicase